MNIKLLGTNEKKVIEERIKEIATAGKLSRTSGTVLDVYNNCKDYEQNLKFIERVINMGHKSIIEHDYLVFSLENVSPIIEQLLIEERFSSFTVKSRREVDFSQVGYYVPNFHDENGLILKDNELLKEKYKLNMNKLFITYKILLDNGVPKEDARYILPYSFNSNMIMGIDAYTLNRLVVRLLKRNESKRSELKELGEQLYNIIETDIPYLKKEIDKELDQKTNDTKELLDKKIINFKGTSVLENVELLSNTNNIDEEIVKSAIMKTYGIPYYLAEESYNKISHDEEFLKKLFLSIYKSDNKDELKQVNFRFQIPISYAALTHLTRHRTHHIMVPDWNSTNNLTTFVNPKTYSEYDKFIVQNAIFKNKMLYDEFINKGVSLDDLIYFHLAGNKINIVSNMDGATLAHILRLRTCNKAQWEIREIANQIKNLVSEKSIYFKNIIGPDCEILGRCPEKKESCGKIKQLKKE